MKEKNIPFDRLEKAVLDQLKEQGYMDSTLVIYRRTFNRIHRFLAESNRQFYCSEVGKEFLCSTHVKDSTRRAYSCAVRRLDDYISNRPYRCHHGGEMHPVPQNYAKVFSTYLIHCAENGNRPATVTSKEVTIARFLGFLHKNGCHSLENLDAGLISKALLIFDNKDNYPRVRQFLSFLFDSGITATDFSGIVPSYNRRKVLPTVYTVEEIKKAEQVIDPSTETGRRDKAMILLATRMGMRAGDIAKLKKDEVDFFTGYLHFIQEKTLFPLTLQMPDEVIRALRTYLDNQKTVFQDDYVFHSMSAPYGRVTSGIIRHAVKRYLTAAGIDISHRKHGPHAFRSSLASSMVKDGGSYETVRRILGHTNPDIIKHYARSDVENLRLCSIEPPQPSGLFKEYLAGKEVGRRV